MQIIFYLNNKQLKIKDNIDITININLILFNIFKMKSTIISESYAQLSGFQNQLKNKLLKRIKFANTI